MADDITLSDVEPYEPVEAAQATPYVSPDVYTPDENGLVSGQMTGLLSSGSDYVENAVNAGERTAASRGLLNSSLAGEASYKAALEAALPIAQQDASAYTAAGMQNNQGEIQGALNTQTYGNDAGLLNVQGAASSQLSAQDAAQEAGLSAQEYGQDTGLQSQAAEQASELSGQQYGQSSELQSQAAAQATELSTQQFGQDTELQTQAAEQAAALSEQQFSQSSELQSEAALQTAELSEQQFYLDNYIQDQLIAANKELAEMDISLEEMNAISTSLTTLGDNLQAKIAGIQVDPDMTADEKTAAIASVQSAFEATITSIGDVYSVSISWDGTDVNQVAEDLDYESLEGDTIFEQLINGVDS